MAEERAGHETSPLILWILIDKKKSLAFRQLVQGECQLDVER